MWYLLVVNVDDGYGDRLLNKRGLFRVAWLLTTVHSGCSLDYEIL